MCRSTMTEIDPELQRLKIRALYLRLSAAGGGGGREPLPETLTLVYPPRIDGNFLEVNGSKIRAEAPAFVPLHRVSLKEPLQTVAAGAEEAVVYASTDRVRTGDGIRFEAYAGEDKVVRGAFCRGAGGRGGSGWRMDCQCMGAVEWGAPSAATAAEVWVVGEGGAVIMRERVEVAAERRRRRRRKKFCLRLDEIPEESDGCDCLCCESGGEGMMGSEGGDSGEVTGGGDLEFELERVRWAVDVGIAVVCLGFGLFVSRASRKGLRNFLSPPGSP